MGILDACLISEAFCRKDSSIGTALALSASGAECLVRFGDAATKESVSATHRRRTGPLRLRVF